MAQPVDVTARPGVNGTPGFSMFSLILDWETPGRGSAGLSPAMPNDLGARRNVGYFYLQTGLIEIFVRLSHIQLSA